MRVRGSYGTPGEQFGWLLESGNHPGSNIVQLDTSRVTRDDDDGQSWGVIGK